MAMGALAVESFCSLKISGQTLGVGSFAIVYKARHRHHGAVALKVLKPQHALSSEETRAFFKEACLLSKHSHR